MQEYIRLISSSSSDVDTVKLVEGAIKAPQLFFYGSLLSLPAVQKLSNNSSFSWVLQVMEVLCYGMLDELQNLPSAVQSSLDPVVYQKLRKLSVLSLCAQNGVDGVLRISDVQRVVGAATPTEAETLLIDMISDGLLRGRIDQRGGVMVLQEFSARDVRLEDVSRLREKLEAWCQHCDAQIKMLREMIPE